MTKKILLALLSVSFFLSTCAQLTSPVSTMDTNTVMTQAFATVNAAITQTALVASPIFTPSPSVIPTTDMLQAILIGTTSCRFGPHKAYATHFKVGVGKYEAIGRDINKEWILIQQPGVIKSCWVEEKFVSLEGEILSLPVISLQLEINDKYTPPTNIIASRTGNKVQITWSDVTIQDRDLSSTGRFLLEIWICENGLLVFRPINTSNLSATIDDQPGCTENSRGLLYTATKRGYSNPAEIPWPQR